MTSLQEQLAALTEPATASDDQSTPTARVLRILQRFLPDDATQDLPLDTPVTDLALDSLDRIEFAVRLEQECGVHVDKEVFEQLRTLDDVCRFVEAAAKKG